MNNQKTIFAIVAIVAEMGLVEAVAVQSIAIPQQAFADSAKDPFHGCNSNC